MYCPQEYHIVVLMILSFFDLVLIDVFVLKYSWKMLFWIVVVVVEALLVA